MTLFEQFLISFALLFLNTQARLVQSSYRFETTVRENIQHTGNVSPNSDGGRGIIFPRNSSMKALGAITDNNCTIVFDNGTSAIWDFAGGPDALDQFTKIWNGNLLYCSNCLGLAKSACTSSSQACNVGLQDASKQDDVVRIDVGLALYTGYSRALTCGAGGKGCDSVSCGQVNNSPAAWVLVESMVHLSNTLNHAFSTLEAAIPAAKQYQKAYSDKWDPSVDVKGDRSALAVFLLIFNGLVGLVPEYGKYAKDFGSALLVAYANSDFTNNVPPPPDVDTLVSQVAWAVTNATLQSSQQLFSQGSYGGDSGSGVRLLDLIKDGALLDIANPSNDFDDLINTYIAILYQGLVHYSLTTFERTAPLVKPFITFAPGKCSDLNYKDGKSVPFPDGALDTLDVNVDYDGSCYWLIYMIGGTEVKVPNGKTSLIPDENYDIFYKGPGTPESIKTFTNKDFGDAKIPQLDLSDMIIPSVRGWQNNGFLNGFPALPAIDGLKVDPKAPAAVNITVCDYMNVWDMPGIGCPVMSRMSSDADLLIQDSNIWPSSDLVNPNNDGYWTPGQCKIHMTQWQNKAQNGANDEWNPYSYEYQLSATVHDHQNRVIGNAAKSFVGAIWELWNTKLPFSLWIRTDKDPNAALELWYSDQHWDTFDHDNQFACTMTPWADGHKNISCTFACPDFKDGDKPAPSATSAFPFPTDAQVQPVIPFGNQAYNSYASKPKPTWDPQMTPTPYTPTDGRCSIHITQYSKGYMGISDYQFEAYLNTWNGAPFSERCNARTVAPQGKAMNIYGLDSYFSVLFNEKGDPMQFNYIGADQKQQEWNSGDYWPLDHDPPGHDCHSTFWGEESREVWCSFGCD